MGLSLRLEEAGGFSHPRPQQNGDLLTFSTFHDCDPEVQMFLCVLLTTLNLRKEMDQSLRVEINEGTASGTEVK